MSTESTKATPLSLLLLGICATIIFFTLRSTSKAEEETHQLLVDLQHYFLPQDGLRYKFRNAIQSRGEEIVRSHYPTVRELTARIKRQPNIDEVYVDWQARGWPNMRLSDELTPPRHFTSLPHQALPQGASLSSILEVVTKQGKTDATASVLDYTFLTARINKTIRSRRGHYSLGEIEIQAPNLMPISTLEVRIDTIQRVPISYSVRLHGYITDIFRQLNAPTYDLPPVTLQVPLRHYPIPHSSLADYIDFANVNGYSAIVDYDTLVAIIHRNEANLRSYSTMSLPVAARESAATQPDFIVLGFSFSNKVVFYLFPILILAVLFAIVNAVSNSLQESTDLEGQDPISAKTRIYKELFPVPMRNMHLVKKWKILLYFCVIPIVSLLVPVIARSNKFGGSGGMLIVMYSLAMIIFFALANRIATLLQE